MRSRQLARALAAGRREPQPRRRPARERARPRRAAASAAAACSAGSASASSSATCASSAAALVLVRGRRWPGPTRPRTPRARAARAARRPRRACPRASRGRRGDVVPLRARGRGSGVGDRAGAAEQQRGLQERASAPRAPSRRRRRRRCRPPSAARCSCVGPPWASSTGRSSLRRPRSGRGMPAAIQRSISANSSSTSRSCGTRRSTCAVRVDVAGVAAAGDAEVGVARLARAVDGAAHDRDLEVLAVGRQAALDGLARARAPRRWCGRTTGRRSARARTCAGRARSGCRRPRAPPRRGRSRARRGWCRRCRRRAASRCRSADLTAPVSERAGLGHAEVQRVVDGRRRGAGRRRSSRARSTT